MACSGWITLARSAEDHPCLGQFDARGVWEKLLLKAAFRPYSIRLNGQWANLERGQLAISVSAFAESGGISRKRMRIILDLFAKEGMIKWGQARGHAFTLITICNYGLYQGAQDSAGPSLGPGKGQPIYKKELTIDSKKESPIGDSKESGASAPAANAAPPRSANGSRLPNEFFLTPEMTRFAKQEGYDGEATDRLFANFCDYWHAKPGAAGRKCDWLATWRNWVRNQNRRELGSYQPVRAERDPWINAARNVLKSGAENGECAFQQGTCDSLFDQIAGLGPSTMEN